MNWVDTAAVYGLGHSEEVVGRALGLYRVGEDVLVSPSAAGGGRAARTGRSRTISAPDPIREECERSLRRLGVERIDLYQAHWPDWTTGTLTEESWGTMVELVDEGKARWIGVCNFDVDQLELRGRAPRRLGPAAAVAARARALHRRAVGGVGTA